MQNTKNDSTYKHQKVIDLGMSKRKTHGTYTMTININITQMHNDRQAMGEELRHVQRDKRKHVGEGTGSEQQ